MRTHARDLFSMSSRVWRSSSALELDTHNVIEWVECCLFVVGVVVFFVSVEYVLNIVLCVCVRSLVSCGSRYEIFCAFGEWRLKLRTALITKHVHNAHFQLRMRTKTERTLRTFLPVSLRARLNEKAVLAVSKTSASSLSTFTM